MIISRTPYRISFFGGGTDYPNWFRDHGGSVLSTTINKYCYISCRKLPNFFEKKHRFVYSKIETVNHWNEIEHPSIRAVLKYLNIQDGLEIHHDGDMPARSGIGSSSAFTVGLINALYALEGKIISKQDLATLAVHIEQNVIGETVGSQDQFAAAFGGLNRIDFRKDNSVDVTPIVAQPNRIDGLNSRFLLFFTGFSRIAETVAKSKVEGIQEKAGLLNTLHSFVDDGISILQSRSSSLDEFGRLLHESWKIKRELSTKVSNSQIDEIYQAGIDSGAIGGKLIGAGGGGFILFYVPHEAQSSVRDKLKNFLEVGFQFENRGSQIVLYNPLISHSSKEPLKSEAII